MSDRWITNLEKTETLEANVAKLEQTLKYAKANDAPTKELAAKLATAKYLLADNIRAMRQIEMENAGRISIGPPRATPYRTSEEIAADDIIGIYRQGAGDGPAQPAEK